MQTVSVSYGAAEGVSEVHARYSRDIDGLDLFDTCQSRIEEEVTVVYHTKTRLEEMEVCVEFLKCALNEDKEALKDISKAEVINNTKRRISQSRLVFPEHPYFGAH